MSTTRILVFAGLTLVLAGLTQLALAGQPIYKVTDRDGNVTYTDQKPSPDAEPLDLPELGVLGDGQEELEQALEGQPQIDPAIEPLTLVITQPVDGTEFSDRGDGVAVVLHSNVELPPSAQIVLYLNDQPQDPIRQLAISLAGLQPGAYRLHAEVQTPSGRLLTRTEEVSFLLRAPPQLMPVP